VALPLHDATLYQKVCQHLSEASERHQAEEAIFQGPSAVLTFCPRAWSNALEAARMISAHSGGARTAIDVGDVTFIQAPTAGMCTYVATGECVAQGTETLQVPLKDTRWKVVVTKGFVSCTGMSTFKHVGFFPRGERQELSLYIPLDMY